MTTKQKFLRYFLGRLIVFILLISAISLLTSWFAGPRAEVLSIASQKAAIEQAMSMNQKYKLARLTDDCLVFSIWNEVVEGNYIVDVRERHNAICGGAPGVSPRLFTLRVEQKTGRVWTDADDISGEYRLLE